jgi:hypothetical protein
LGIAEVIADVVGHTPQFDFPVERALFAMVANRACAPSSKLYWHEQWLREEVRTQEAKRHCEDTWHNIRDDLKQIQLAQLSSPDGTIWQVTEPPEGAANRLPSLKINKPPPLLRFD